jgi:hypothetical protein
MDLDVKLPAKLPDIPEIKVAPITVKLYDAEKNTLLGIPVPALILAGAALGLILIIKKRKA